MKNLQTAARVGTIVAGVRGLGALSGMQLIPAASVPVRASAQVSSGVGPTPSANDHAQVLRKYCITCHNQRVKTAGLELDKIDTQNLGDNAEIWEKVARKIR